MHAKRLLYITLALLAITFFKFIDKKNDYEKAQRRIDYLESVASDLYAQLRYCKENPPDDGEDED
jgi:hypothetical protein